MDAPNNLTLTAISIRNRKRNRNWCQPELQLQYKEAEISANKLQFVRAIQIHKMFNVKPLTNEVVKKIDCPGCFDHAEVTLSDGSTSRSCVMIQKYMELFAERVKNMEVYEDDMWVVTFPKCGTTWTQEMVWLVNNDLNYEKALEVNLNDRFPFLE